MNDMGITHGKNTPALLKQAQRRLDKLRHAVSAQLAQRDAKIAEQQTIIEIDEQAIAQRDARIAELENERKQALAQVATITTDPYDRDDLVNGVSTLCAIIADYRVQFYGEALPFELVPAPVNPDAPAGLETPDFSTELGWLRHIKLVAREFVDSVASPMETWGNEEHPAWQAYWSLALSMGEFDLWRKEVATPAETVKVFGSMSQHNDWHVRNCNQCRKGSAQNDNTLVCPIEEALHIAALTDGKVSVGMAQRMGHQRGRLMPITWDCPERENISAPAELEYVKADPMKFIAHNYEPGMHIQQMTSLLTEAFGCDDALAKRWITDWIIARNKAERENANA